MSTGYLVAIEGLDGAGKRSVTSALTAILAEEGQTVANFAFPRYNSPTGSAIKRYLQDAETEMPAKAAAILFAADRLNAREELRTALAQDAVVLVDRYVASNIAYQAGRVAPQKRGEFAAWVETIEYELMRMPEPNLTLFLDVDLADSRSRTSSRPVDAGRSTDDHYESNVDLLSAAAAQYRQMSERPDWISIDASRMHLEAVVEQCWTELAPKISEP